MAINSQKSGFKNKCRRGESLVEVIMAIFVVAMGSSVAASLIISALQSNAFSRDNLVALNLAVEGVEAVRAVRDANWLKFSYDKTNCWNMKPDAPPDVDCTLAKNAIADGQYTVDLDLKLLPYQWGLTSQASPLSLDSSGNNTGATPYQLSYFDVKGITVMANGNSGAVKSSPFYRMVEIHYPSSKCASPSPCDEMEVTSKVQWMTQGNPHTVLLQTKLTNYQQVKVQ